MTNAKPTPGPWFVVYETTIMTTPTPTQQNYPSMTIAQLPNDFSYNPETETSDIRSDIKQNAALIAEAGTVYHETGMTPRQLAERVDEQAAEIGELKFLCSNYKSSDEAYQEQIAALSKQRDELLVALENSVCQYVLSVTKDATLARAVSSGSGFRALPSNILWPDWVIKARAAIANAKGGAA